MCVWTNTGIQKYVKRKSRKRNARSFFFLGVSLPRRRSAWPEGDHGQGPRGGKATGCLIKRGIENKRGVRIHVGEGKDSDAESCF